MWEKPGVAPFERADRVHREPGDRAQLLLREAGGLAELPEMRAERPRARNWH